MTFAMTARVQFSACQSIIAAYYSGCTSGDVTCST